MSDALRTLYDDGTSQLERDLGRTQREHKYLLDRNAAVSFWAVAASRLRLDEDPRWPIGYVRTTYFDTTDFAYYRASAGGMSRRNRVRECAAATERRRTPVLTGICVLELKQSSGGRRSKSRLPVAPADVPAQLARFGDRPLVPCLTTWYQRTALTDGSDAVRITLDAHIRFCAPTAVGTPCPSVEPAHVLARGPAFVLEVKLWDAPPAWLARALSGLAEAVGFSKFMAGMRAAEQRTSTRHPSR